MKSHESFQDAEKSVRKYAPSGVKKLIRYVKNLVGNSPDFVIVSTGRAGSGYTAHLLKQANLQCSHERFFRPHGFYKNFRYDGDSSWLAVPYLEERSNLTKRVVHQVRNPMDVVSSLYGIGFFDPGNENDFSRFVRKHFEVTDNPLIDSVRFWTEWNERCEKISDSTYLFEDLLEDPSIVFSALDLVLDDVTEELLESVSKTKVNSRKRIEITLNDIPDGVEKDKMLALATRYGYHLD